MNGYTTVGATSTLIRPVDQRRRRISFVNDSDEKIYICQGPASSGSGITLAPYGSYEDLPDNSGYIFKGAWCAICASGGKNLSWVEEYVTY